MSHRPKVHVFLGSPPPSCGPDRGSDTWRILPLTWQDGHLRPAVADPPSPSLTRKHQEPSSDPDRGHGAGSDHGFRSRDEVSHMCSSSIHEYLDQCFPTAPPETRPEPGPRQGSPLSAQTQYLSTWTLSQALILRGQCGVQSAARPDEAPSPKTPSPKTPSSPAQSPRSSSSSTPELFSPAGPSPWSPRVEEGGVVLQVSSGGLLCSQEALPPRDLTPRDPTPRDPPPRDLSPRQLSPRDQPIRDQPPRDPTPRDLSPRDLSPRDQPPRDPSPTPPASKTLRLCENYRTTSDHSTSTTPLIHCHQPGRRCSVLVAVVHPCYLKEVKVKSGRTAGTVVPLASIVVTDQSGTEMKVVLWRRAAFWALTCSPGHVLLLTGLQVSEDRWRGETLLQSTYNSKLLNLGHITSCTSPAAPQQVDARSLSSLCGFLRDRRPLLVSLRLRPPQDTSRLPYSSLRSLRVNTLTHALLRVTHTHTSAVWRDDADSRCRSATHLQAVLTVEQPGGQQGALLLWGTTAEGLQRFNRDRECVWDFRLLLVREGVTSDPELHSTPWTSVQPLSPVDPRLIHFLQPEGPVQTRDSTLELDLDTLLSQKHSGEVELRVQVVSFHFLDCASSHNAPGPVLDGSTPLDAIVAALSDDITYIGCGRCSVELETDANGIYYPCYPCLPCTAVRRYYRPGVLTVRGQDSSAQVCVQAPPLPVQRILEAPPDKLHRCSAPGSGVRLVLKAAQRIRTLVSVPRKTFIIIIRSHFLCDDNGATIRQEFTLQELQL